MGWLSKLFGGDKEPNYLNEALRDQEEPVLDEAEANAAVTEYKKLKSSTPFWTFLRGYKARLRRATVRPDRPEESCCGGVCGESFVSDVEDMATNVVAALNVVPSSPAPIRSTDDSPVDDSPSASSAPEQSSSWRSDPEPSAPAQSSSWNSDNSGGGYTPSSNDYSSGSSDYSSSSSSSYDSGSSGGCDSGGGGGGGDF